jgi:hypothetical protein
VFLARLSHRYSQCGPVALRKLNIALVLAGMALVLAALLAHVAWHEIAPAILALGIALTALSIARALRALSRAARSGVAGVNAPTWPEFSGTPGLCARQGLAYDPFRIVWGRGHRDRS